ncbi:MAG TPA: DUF4349 domain-containing protein [Oscillospiraceae bacterium]|nr:DUF4349 domain-containing protein [Oscillospiraceae bacterium]HPS34150.1 DUF4349 domain-containing protein [Oscillospiraceae bacterium]
MKKALLFLIVLVLLMGGCSATSREAPDDQLHAMGLNGQLNEMAPATDYDTKGGMVASVASAPAMVASAPSMTTASGSSVPPVQSSRKLIYNVAITMETLKYEETLPAIKARCAAANGYIEGASEVGVNLNSTGKRSAALTMRIPASNLDAFLNDVTLMGNVISNTKSTQDITGSYYDTEAHLKTLRVQEERYLALLEKADSMEDILTIENALSNVRYQIESLTGTLQRYDSQVEYSTVTISLREVGETTQPEPETFWQRIGNAFTVSVKAIWKFAKWCVVALVAILPFLVIIALIIVMIILLVHRRKVKRAKSKAANPPDVK